MWIILKALLVILFGVFLVATITWIVGVIIVEVSYRQNNPRPLKYSQGDLVRVSRWARLDPWFYLEFAHAERKGLFARNCWQINNGTPTGKTYTIIAGRDFYLSVKQRWLVPEFYS